MTYTGRPLRRPSGSASKRQRVGERLVAADMTAQNRHVELLEIDVGGDFVGAGEQHLLDLEHGLVWALVLGGEADRNVVVDLPARLVGAGIDDLVGDQLEDMAIGHDDAGSDHEAGARELLAQRRCVDAADRACHRPDLLVVEVHPRLSSSQVRRRGVEPIVLDEKDWSRAVSEDDGLETDALAFGDPGTLTLLGQLAERRLGVAQDRRALLVAGLDRLCAEQIGGGGERLLDTRVLEVGTDAGAFRGLQRATPATGAAQHPEIVPAQTQLGAKEVEWNPVIVLLILHIVLTVLAVSNVPVLQETRNRGLSE